MYMNGLNFFQIRGCKRNRLYEGNGAGGIYFLTLGMLFSILSSISLVKAGALLPDYKTHVGIEGVFSEPQPAFLLIFSASPLLDAQRHPVANIAPSAALKFPARRDYVGVKVSGKAAVAGRFDYYFGPGEDVDQPWNNGSEFKWQSWDSLPPDIWDNVSIVCLPTATGKVEGMIQSVQIRRNGQLLFDSKAAKSYPNKKPLAVAFPPFSVAPVSGQLPVLNLGQLMKQFCDSYYEVGGNPVLSTAYSDLGQTDKTKYAKRGENWCSEFASWVFRQSGIRTPDPNAADVHFQNMHQFFERSGAVYPASEVATWSSQKKIDTIVPGSYVSILIGDSTHTIIFNGWIGDASGEITHYAGISGNNRGMVWSHAPLPLPKPEDLKGKTKKEQADFDQKVFFGVPKPSRASKAN